MEGKNRKLNRLRGWDYSQAGWYYITICTKNRLFWFGNIVNGEMVLNDYGIFVRDCWLDIPKHFPECRLDYHIIMPDHIHGILYFDHNVGNKNVCSLPWQTKWSKSISSIVRGFKIGVTKYFRENGDNEFVWQKSFYDHIIRNEQSLNKIRAYIENNPLNWQLKHKNMSFEDEQQLDPAQSPIKHRQRGPIPETTETQLTEIQALIKQVEKYLSFNDDPHLHMEKKPVDPVVLERLKKLVAMSGSTSPLNVENTMDYDVEDPAYNNKWRTRWFELLFSYLKTLMEYFDYSEDIDRLEQIKKDFSAHNYKYSEIKKTFAQGDEPETNFEYQRYKSERKSLIVRLNELGERCLSHAKEDVKKVRTV